MLPCSEIRCASILLDGRPYRTVPHRTVATLQLGVEQRSTLWNHKQADAIPFHSIGSTLSFRLELGADAVMPDGRVE